MDITPLEPLENEDNDKENQVPAEISFENFDASPLRLFLGDMVGQF